MTPAALVKYDAACAALAAASKVDEAKSIRDKAEAFRVYAIQAKNHEMERQAMEIRLRAERRCGQLLAESAKNGERTKQGGDRKSKSVTTTLIPKLEDLGISKDQSATWQKIAAVPENDFESRVGAAAASNEKITTRAILGNYKEAERRRSASKEYRPTDDEKARQQATAERLQNAANAKGMGVEIVPTRDGKFRMTAVLSESDIQQAIDSCEGVKA